MTQWPVSGACFWYQTTGQFVILSWGQIFLVPETGAGWNIQFRAEN